MVTVARIGQLRLGNEVFRRPVVALADLYWSHGGEPAPVEHGNIIGMNLLLQYSEVCFDWLENKLHLGDFEPCAQGISPYRIRLTGTQGITLDATIASNGFAQAKIDTGAVRSFCSKSFLQHNEARMTFAFGRNAELTGTCTYDPAIVFGEWNDGEKADSPQILLGMDTLKEFASFGWRLNPLEVFFTPMASDPNQFPRTDSTE